ncbi:MAG: hypothetical protein ACI87J_002704, partial [Colwellia sp.]
YLAYLNINLTVIRKLTLLLPLQKLYTALRFFALQGL